jgi:hypothetical protein
MEFGLDADEREYVEATDFRPLDAHYLAQAFELRDTARSLGASELPKLKQAELELKQAELAFQWVMRQVILRERDDELWPPQFVLQCGQGTARERALVFLALAHQFNIDGCMLAVPGDAPDRPHFWAAGVLIKDDSREDIFLFDPRLGVPIPGPGGKGIATLAQLRARPDLLQPFMEDKHAPYDVTPEQARPANVYVVGQLSALAPRMKYLEDLLSSSDPIKLAVEPSDLLTRFKAAAASEVRFWNQASAPERPAPSSPTRALRLFMPTEEGGVDKTTKAVRLGQHTVPLAAMTKALRDMRLDEELPVQARERLLVFAVELYKKYAVTPHEDLLRGRFVEATRQLMQARSILNECDDARLPEPDFLKQVGRWREEAKQAILDDIRKEPGAQRALAKVWKQDQYLLALLGTAADESERQKLQKTALTFIVMRCVEAPLRHDVSYLLALCWQEKAERLQTLQKRQEEATRAWLNVQDWWNKHAERYPYSPMTVKTCLAAVANFWRAGKAVQAVGYLEWALAETRAGFHGRLLQADGLAKAGKPDKAREVLTNLAADLGAFGRDPDLTKAVKLLVNAAGTASGDLPTRLRSLDRDLGPGGSFTWMQAAASYRLQQLAK